MTEAGEQFLNAGWHDAVGRRLVGVDVGQSISGWVEVSVADTSSRSSRGRRPRPATSGDEPQLQASAFISLAEGQVVSYELTAPGECLASFMVPPDAAQRILAGALEPSVAFMQGVMKVAGDMGAVLALLKATVSPGFSAGCKEVSAATVI